jgi:hypothetical protein
MSLLSLLNKTATVRRYTDAKSTVTGGVAPTYADTTGVVCTLQVLQTGQIHQPAEAGQSFGNAFFAYGTDVKQGDVLLSVTGYTSPNWMWSVTSDPVDDAGRGKYLRVEVTHKAGQVAA